MLKYDAVVVGGGPGGYECAIRLARNGKRTALVEKDKLGGTCLNRGCIPTKTLLHSADVYYEAVHGSTFGVSVEGASFDYAGMIARKNAVSAQLSQGIGFLEKSYGVDVIGARAALTGAHTMELSDGRCLEAEYVVLATGSVPVKLPIPGIDLPGVVDSTGLLDRTVCPDHIIIAGGGVIGIEFATFFSRLGVRVTVMEMMDRVLGPLDRDIAALVERKLKRSGVELLLGVKAVSVEPGLKVNYTSVKDGNCGSVQGDTVLIAGGRKANSAGLELERAGIRTDSRGYVEVDGMCRTNVPGVYAIGDLNGRMRLAHAASAQGLLAADHIAGKPCRELNYDHIPSCVYCNPEAAMVGLTEEQARAAGRDVGTGLFSLAGNGKAMTMGQNEGLVKFVFDRHTDELLGAHILAPRATDLAAEAAAVMECGGTVASIGHTVHPHPTISEVMMETAHVCHDCCVNVPKPRR